MIEQMYRVAQGCVKVPRDPKSKRTFSTRADFLVQGDIVPEGVLSAEDIASLLAAGKIEPLIVQRPEEARGLPQRAGKWSVDPVALVGKSFEDLLIMVQEIDEDFDVTLLQDAGQAVRQLTQDWNPAFRDQIAKASDKSRPERLGPAGAKDLGVTPLSEAAERALAQAKSRAAGQPQGS